MLSREFPMARGIPMAARCREEKLGPIWMESTEGIICNLKNP